MLKGMGEGNCLAKPRLHFPNMLRTWIDICSCSPTDEEIRNHASTNSWRPAHNGTRLHLRSFEGAVKDDI